MKAVVTREFGNPEVLNVEEVETPEAGLGEALVRVAAAGINPADTKTRSGMHGEMFGAPPLVLGWELSGTVEAVGWGVANVQPGDEVLGLVRFPGAPGTWAEYAAVPAYQLALKPRTLSFAAAGALPLTGLTALQALDRAEVGPGQRVLVHAAAGGVGHLAVQIAKLRGAYVIGTARAEKREFLEQLGVDEVIDYSAAPFEESVADVDVAIDLIGGEYAVRTLEVLRPGGTLVVIAAPLDEGAAGAVAASGVRVINHLVHPDRAGLERLLEMVETDELQIGIASEFGLDHANEANALSETGRTRGKIVLVPRT
jgi:NADPH:quinone reductase-like Zn-dependent oxidoreductase